VAEITDTRAGVQNDALAPHRDFHAAGIAAEGNMAR